MSVDLSDAEAQSIYAFAKNLAVKAGQMILDASSNRFKQTQSSGPLQTKKNSVVRPVIMLVRPLSHA